MKQIVFMLIAVMIAFVFCSNGFAEDDDSGVREIRLSTLFPSPQGYYKEITLNGSFTGSGTALEVIPTFTANADANVFNAVYINPTFDDGGYDPRHNGLIVMNSNVGLGTVSPAFRLDVENLSGSTVTDDTGTVAKFGSVFPIYLENDWPTVGFNSYWNYNTTTSSGEILLGKGSTDHYGADICFQPSAGNLWFRVSNTKGAAGSGIDLNANKKMVIQANGNVGIGDLTPSVKLEVAGGPIKATGGLIIQVIPSGGTPPTSPADGQIWLDMNVTP